MKRLSIFAFLISLCISNAIAQIREEIIEITISVGSEIDANENKKYQLFPNVPNFIKAEIIAIEDHFEQIITIRENGKVIRLRTQISLDELEKFREKIREIDSAGKFRADREVSKREKQEGRYSTIAVATGIGTYVYARGATVLLEPDDPAIFFVTIPPAFFGASLYATRNYEMGYGRSRLLNGGAIGGILYGAMLPVLIDPDNAFDTPKSFFGSMMLTTPIGAGASRLLTKDRWFEKGEADMLVNGGLAGGLYGLATSFLIHGTDPPEERFDLVARTYVTSVMLGIPIGIYATPKFFDLKKIDQGHASMIQIGGVNGAAYGWGLFHLLAGLENHEFDHNRLRFPRGHIFSACLGFATGTYLMHQHTKDQPYSIGRTWLIALGEFVGFMAGLQFANMVGFIAADSSRATVASLIVGSATGLFVADRFTQNWGEMFPTVRSEKFDLHLPSIGDLITYTSLRKRNAKAVLPIVRVAF